MNHRVLIFWRQKFFLLAALLAGCATGNGPSPGIIPVYPRAAKVDQSDDYHGTKVADPYRWLEDDNSEKTKAWVEAENKVTFDFLGKIPQREAIKRRLTELWNFERFGMPFKEGGRYFIARNNGLQNQGVLYTMQSVDAEPAVLLDPNTLSADGTVSLQGYAVSDDGNRLAYGLARAGSDWQDWHVRDVRTGKDLPDMINWVKFSGASWTKDNQGFFYSQFNEPNKTNALKGVNYFHKLYYHKLGTMQAEDKLIYDRPDQKEWGFSGEVTEDGHYLAIHVSKGSDRRNRFYYRDLRDANAPVVELLNDFDASYGFIGNVGTVFYFKTDLNSPLGRVIAIDVTRPDRKNWDDVIPQTGDALEGVTLVNDQFVVMYLKDAHSLVKIFGRDGKFVRAVDLPGLGSVGGFGGKRKDTETYYEYTGFTMPLTIYRYDLTTGASTIFRQPKVKFNSADYETTQMFYQSKDGTRVPMFITSRKGTKRDGKNPVYLYGYGGFDISITPSFSPAIAAWLELGGVFAVANIRGGSEYGEGWHQAGMKLKKQNVFDDFIGAAEWLIANHYTRREKLAIGGGSNGGLLVGACMTQRPDLFGAALPSVGVMDMLRFNKFTIGWAWQSDYGSPENPNEFKALYAYSPLHNIHAGTKYPATMITTGDHDDRVVPAHSFKFAATLQAAQAGSKPVLIRIETRAGHGAGKPTTKLIEESADKWAFLVQELGMNPQNLANASGAAKRE